jgi:lipoprotein-anchoring transpeptidase ErfK/SrfK
MMRKDKLSRREFLKYSALAFGGLALSGSKMRSVFAADNQSQFQQQVDSPEFPVDIPLGRICYGQHGTRYDIKSEPNINAPSVGIAWYDDVFEWKKEVVTNQVDINNINQRWVEVPEGYIYADNLQPVRHIPQKVLNELPETPDGSRGMWVEITTPFTPLDLTKLKSNYQYWISREDNINPRLYYSQVLWAFDIRNHPITGKSQYCLMQRVGANPENYWVDASVCRQITPEEIAPIHLEAEDKRIVIQIRPRGLQTLSCFEGNEEVFFAIVSTGGRTEEGKWSTPIGNRFSPWRKNISMHYSQTETLTGGFDIPGVGWNLGFHPDGAFIHSTFWHNAFGNLKSAGCVNMRPEEAKWVWRWVDPQISYYEGDRYWSGIGLSTPVTVELLG